MQRHLYLCCYDIQDENIRRKIRDQIKKYSGVRQYSAYECYLTPDEKESLLKRLTSSLEEGDTLQLQFIAKTADITALGAAEAPLNPDFTYWS